MNKQKDILYRIKEANENNEPQNPRIVVYIGILLVFVILILTAIIH